MTTTARRDLRRDGYALLQGFSGLEEVHATRPSHFNRPMPFGYMDILAESATHDSGTRERVFSPSFVFVFDPDLETDGIDEVVDTFADYLTAHPHIVANTIWDTWTVTEEAEEVQSETGSVRYFPVVRFTLGNVSIREGRA